MTAAEIKPWAEIIEIALKCVAILAAGFWAVSLHKILRHREAAQAGLRKIEAEIRELDLKVKQQAVVRVDIHPTVHQDREGGGYLILTTVDLANRGTRNTRIKWRDQLPAFY